MVLVILPHWRLRRWLLHRFAIQLLPLNKSFLEMWRRRSLHHLQQWKLACSCVHGEAGLAEMIWQQFCLSKRWKFHALEQKLGPVVPGGSALCGRPHLREMRIETSETFGKLLLSSTNPKVLGPRLAIIASTCFSELVVWWVQHIVSLGSTENFSGAWPISGLSNSMVGTSFNWQANLDERLYGRMSLVHIDALPWGKQTQDTTGTQALAPIGKVTLGGRPPCRMHRMFMAPTHLKPRHLSGSLSTSDHTGISELQAEVRELVSFR